MAIIYVKEQGAVIRKRGGRILVEKDHKTLLEIPLRQTETVAVFGNVQVTTQALSELLERGIPLALFTRNGRLKGHLAPEASKNIELRLHQYRMAFDDAGSLEIAKRVVFAKLWNSSRVIAGYRSNYPSETLRRAEGSILDMAEKSKMASTLAELLGSEGAAAAAYFEAFREMNRSEFPFEGRRKHPAPDPLNALLSFGYVLVTNEIRALAEGAGLEPHLGFLHRVDYGRPSLALDLLEPFRAILVDRLTLRLANERILKAEDFARRATGDRAGSVVLMPAALDRYLARYEEAIEEPRKGAPDGIRRMLETEVAKLARALRENCEFEPYREGV